LDYNFIVKERIECKWYHVVTRNLCIHIEAANLADGTYELVPTHENDFQDAQANLSEVIQDPEQSPEEPKASSAQESKPRYI